MIFYPVISAPFVRFCNDLHPLHVLKPCKNRAETVHLLPDKLKSTSSDNDLTALVWVAILLFLVLAASQADWKASDLILSITRRFVLEKSNTAWYGLYGLVVVSFCQQENNIKRKEKQMMKRIFTLITSIVPFRSHQAAAWASLQAQRQSRGQPVDWCDRNGTAWRFWSAWESGQTFYPAMWCYAGRWRHGLTHKIDVQVFFRFFFDNL